MLENPIYYFDIQKTNFREIHITNEASFQSISTWYEQAVKEAGKDFSIILVGNKCDLESERKVSKEQGEEKARSMNASFFETSALSKVNIDDIFNEIVNNIFQRTKGQKNDDDDDIEIINENEKAINLTPQPTPEKKGCC